MSGPPAGEPGRPALRIGGIPVHVPWSGILGVALIAWLWLPRFRAAEESAVTTYVLAGAFALLLYACVLAHELAHALAARRLGFRVTHIVLWFLGGYTVYERRTATPGRDAVVAAAGPLATIVLAAGFAGIALGAGSALPAGVDVLVEALAFGNGLLAFYNLLPGLPLDGGAILKAAAWAVTGSERRGAVIAAWSGRVLAVLLLVAPFAAAAAGGTEPSIALVATVSVFAAILWLGATSALRRARVELRAEGLTARGLARRAVPALRDTPLAEALRAASEEQAGAIVVVEYDGRPLGIVHEAAVAATPLERRPWVPVVSVARRVEAGTEIGETTSGLALLEALSEREGDEHLVVDPDGRVVGVLATADVERRLRG